MDIGQWKSSLTILSAEGDSVEVCVIRVLVAYLDAAKRAECRCMAQLHIGPI